MSPSRATPRRLKLDNFTYAQHVEYCFHRPCDKDDLPEQLRITGYRPVLHLLRRDLQPLYEKEDLNAGSLKPPFVVLSALMTGFDILSSLSNEEETESPEYQRARDLLEPHGLENTIPMELGRKFKRFVSQYANQSDTDAEFLWRIRGSVIHTYSLTLARTKYPHVTVDGDPTPDGSPVVTRRPSRVRSEDVTEHVLHLWSLRRSFLDSVARFRVAVESAEHETLGKVFMKQMLKAGYIQVPLKPASSP